MSRRAIERDLREKLQLDLRRAALHYAEMCDVAGISMQIQTATLCAAFCGALVQLAVYNGIEDERVLRLTSETLTEARKQRAKAARR